MNTGGGGEEGGGGGQVPWRWMWRWGWVSHPDANTADASAPPLTPAKDDAAASVVACHWATARLVT
jgi:hypothetical protein